jgi:hypothetical protein
MHAKSSGGYSPAIASNRTLVRALLFTLEAPFWANSFVGFGGDMISDGVLICATSLVSDFLVWSTQRVLGGSTHSGRVLANY